MHTRAQGPPREPDQATHREDGLTGLHVRGQLKVPEGKPHCCPAARPEESKPCRRARPYLGKHGLPVLGDHHTLVAVHRDGRAVVGLLRVSEDVVEVGHPSFKHSAEIARDEGPANSWKRQAEKQTINDDIRWAHTPHTTATPPTGYSSYQEANFPSLPHPLWLTVKKIKSLSIQEKFMRSSFHMWCPSIMSESVL